MVLHHLQPSFTGGEISPSLCARADAAEYNTWLRQATNFIVHPQGGISNRPGTYYMGSAKNTNKACRLFSFPISDEEAYVIEAGEQYFRFFTSAGAVLNSSQLPLEITTPYSQQDLPKLQTAQYNNTLYVAHPAHPLMRLTRSAVGQFTWEEAPLKYGPFMPANTDPSKQMRVYPQTTSVVSEGVPARLSFAPVNYSNLMVYAYFNGEWFYASETFGLNLSEIVAYFNDAYSSRGLRASSQGSILSITSAAADGANWNGKNLVLEYRSTFYGAATHTVTQTLSGGENAGIQTVAQPGRYLLESSHDYFTPLHVGGRFSLVHMVDGQHKSGTLGYESTSGVIQSGSDWTLRTSGTWTGTLYVEVSYDLGTTWNTLKVLSRASGEDNFYLVGNLNDAENMFLLRVRSYQISGEAGYELDAQSFIQRAVLKVSSYTSATQVVVEAERLFGSQGWTPHWAEGSFSPAAGYPACVFIFQNRLGLAATSHEAQTLWFSKAGNFMDFGSARDEQLSTDSLAVQLGGTQQQAIVSVLVANRLLVLTTTGEWTLSCNGAFTLDDIQLEQQSSRGACNVSPVLIGNRVVFVQRGGFAIRELVYDYATSSYTSNDLTLCAKHLFYNQSIVQLAFAQNPDHLLWCITQEGELLSATYVPEQNICAWTRQQTQGQFISLCLLGDEVWFAVKRSGGIFLEKLCERMKDKTPQAQLFLDSAVSYTFSQAQTQLTGISHLEGKQVNVLADGNVIENRTVQNGQITLPYAACVVHVGLGYTAQLYTLPLSSAVIAQRKHRLVALSVKMLDSRGGEIGTSLDHMTQLVQRTDEPYNTPVSLQTQDANLVLSCSHQYAAGVFVRQTQPLPLTVLALWVQAA